MKTNGLTSDTFTLTAEERGSFSFISQNRLNKMGEMKLRYNLFTLFLFLLDYGKHLLRLLSYNLSSVRLWRNECQSFIL